MANFVQLTERITDAEEDPIFLGISEPVVEEEEELQSSIILEPGTTRKLVLNGEFFHSELAIAMVARGEDREEAGEALPLKILSDKQVEVDITGTTEGLFDLLVNVNAGFDMRLPVVEVKYIPWIDLREGGDTFADGDITWAERLSMSRTAEGMIFSGDTGWDTWAYFPFMEHSRSQPKKYEWIFTHTTGAMMIGIGGANANSNTTRAYYDAEVVAYFNSQTRYNRMYGDSSNGGTQIVVTAAGVKKLVLEHNGEAGYNLYVYEIPSADPSDWDDESNLKGTNVIPSVFKQSDSPIAPYFTCHNSTHRLIAVRSK